jgi:DNA-directed RNA polymerase subunit M/transcription elongation factor TFIIS
MEAFKAKAVKPARRVVAKKKTGQAAAEDNKKTFENTVSQIIHATTGLSLSSESIESILKNLNIDPSIPLTDNEKFILYNVLMDPVVPFIQKDDPEYVIETDKLTEEEYLETEDTIAKELDEMIPSNRAIGLYDVLPSLKFNRINFDIEKDMFRNKPLLGKGLFKCKYCGSDNTEDYEIQTRRADEGAFVKVICRACTKQYIIT